MYWIWWTVGFILGWQVCDVAVYLFDTYIRNR